MDGRGDIDDVVSHRSEDSIGATERCDRVAPRAERPNPFRLVSPPAEDRPFSNEDRKREGYF